MIKPSLAEFILPGTFGLPLIMPNTEQADALRDRLVGHGVYPARIWPQPLNASIRDRNLSSRFLLLHTDHRYSQADMRILAGLLNEVAPNRPR